MRTRTLVARPARFALSPVAAGVALAFAATTAAAGPTINVQDGAAAGAFITAPAHPLPLAAAAPTVTFSPSILNLGNVVEFTTSAPRTVTLTYTSGYTIADFESDPNCYGGPWSGSAIGGFFSYTSDCTFNTPLPAGSCHFTATYTSFSLVANQAVIYACAGSFAPTGSFEIDAVGIPPPPVTFNPSSWDFGAMLLGGTGPTKNFILFNPDPFDINVSPPFVTTDDFLVRDTDCTSVLTAFSRCNVSVQFTPKATGQRTAQLEVQGFGGLAASEGPKVLVDTFYGPPVALANLSGTAVVQADLGVPDSVDFGSLTVGSPAQSIPVQVTNEGNGVLTISSVSITAPFTLTNNCPINLNPGESCTLVVGFDPTTISNPQGTLTIQSNSSEGTHNIPVTANVVVATVPDIRVTPTLVGFGSRMAGTLSAPQHITVTNVGGALANLEALQITPEFLISANTCGTTLPPGASCTADITFQPVGFGPRRGALTVSGNDAGSPHNVTLTGAGCRPFSVAFSGVAFDPCAP